MNQDELKDAVGRAALTYVRPNTILGIGTGSTVNRFIAALGEAQVPLAGTVSSSERSSELLRGLGYEVLDANDVEGLDLYVDGADEIDPHGYLIKGGGAALTREKIVAALASTFVCIADGSKLVDALGAFPLPVEVIPMAAEQVRRRFAAGVLGLTGDARLRLKDGAPLVTDNGQHLLDVHGLRITDPVAFEQEVGAWPGVVTVGVFARQKASVSLIGTEAGVQTITY